mmetsp:Transcript_32505/g.24017  ORF Transcript_32505/g.24017 Transcript_32505/m.24017 type:complete len:99 (-) Transcript_32505:454-750(-)
MRFILGCAITFHLFSFVVSLAIIGFWAMAEDLSLAALAFSGYLTLFDWVISFYMIGVGGSILGGVFMLFKFQAMPFSYFAATTFLYCSLLYLVAYAYN